MLSCLKPDLLCIPAYKLTISSVSFIKDDPGIGCESQVVYNISVMFLGFCQPNKFGYTTEGVHQGMNIKSAVLPGPIQSVATHTTRNFTEQLEDEAVNDL